MLSGNEFGEHERPIKWKDVDYMCEEREMGETRIILYDELDEMWRSTANKSDFTVSSINVGSLSIGCKYRILTMRIDHTSRNGNV